MGLYTCQAALRAGCSGPALKVDSQALFLSGTSAAGQMHEEENWLSSEKTTK